MEKPLTHWQVLKIFLISFFLTPLGLIWFFKYLKSTDDKKRTVGLISLVITVVTLVVSYFVTKAYVGNILKYTQLYSTGLGF